MSIALDTVVDRHLQLMDRTRDQGGSMRKLLAATLLLIGCGTDGVDGGEPLIDGFDLPAPKSDEMQVIGPAVHGIEPGADVTLCSYLDQFITKETDIIDYRGFQSSVGAHHTILYAVNQQEPKNTHECTEDDMVNARYLAGGGADTPGADLPDGVVFRMPANTQLMIQTHWINATDEPIDGQAAFNLKVTAPKPEHLVSQLFTVGNTQFNLPQGVGSASAECTVEKSMNVFTLSGHMHEWGTYAKITHAKATSDFQMLWESDWSAEKVFAAPLNQYTTANPLVLAPGDKLHIDCEYDNDTGHDLPFPHEMCIAFAYAYPMVNQIDCMDGHWPTDAL